MAGVKYVIENAQTLEKFANEAKELYGDEFELLSKYVNNSTPVRIKHNCPDCNYSETLVYPSDFLHNGVTCHQCAKNTAAKKRTISQIGFEKTVRFLTDDEYSVLSKYTKATEEVMFRHNCPDCNYYVFSKKAIKFTSCGERCPICSRKYSGGVRRINKILRERNITFSCEKTYNNLIGVHKLRYDFCIENIESHMLIEFDGLQHFTPTIWEKITDLLLQRQEALERLMLQHEYDIKKNRYAEKNRIPLLRIRYDQIDRVEELVDDLLERPEWYITNHNKFLSEADYYAPFYENVEKYQAKSQNLQVVTA